MSTREREGEGDALVCVSAERGRRERADKDAW